MASGVDDIVVDGILDGVRLAGPDARGQVVGLTSPAHRAFIKGLGCYSRVLTYDELPALAVDGGIAFVDMAGAPALRRAVPCTSTRVKRSASRSSSERRTGTAHP